eukprot:TRINITY_DN35357_c0_g1_i1.p1 TRINITY_DN35357_c0_g1~~TRINITY_DN35357_c0_g1_i1.p1  ORF type:complete len:870 (-),score=215.92 TRINITY_DN35357_c0_g1_i1:253-2766(-)
MTVAVGQSEQTTVAPNIPNLDSDVPGEPDSDTVYLGAVKSYNDRRGFGFVACAETAADFGRDVYMAKLEAQMAALDACIDISNDTPEQATEKLNQRAATVLAMESSTKSMDKHSFAPRLAEEDLVRFKVKLSIEGFPQAVQVQRMRKFTGTVIKVPSFDGDEQKPGVVRCNDVAQIFKGKTEVMIPQEACGQLCVLAGDKVTFCIPEELDGVAAKSKAGPLEAKLVMLGQSQRPSGSVLGCFLLNLPRPTPSSDGKVRYLNMDCHAFGSRVIMSGLPSDVGEAELMRFFSKQGATSAIVAHARGCSFASITFPSVSEVSTFLGRSAHAFADDKETRIATLHQHSKKNGLRDACRLPALPAPTLSHGEEPGSILAIWAPLQLATGYVVEIRPAGSEAAWAPVDVTGRVGAEKGRFDPACSSCKVTGLRPGASYEVRMSYFASCCCRAEASDASQACAPMGGGQMMPQQNMPPPMQQAQMPPMPAHMYQGYPEVQGGAMPGLPPQGPCFQCPPAAPQGFAQPSPNWRCVHGAVVPPPPMPEVLPGDEAGFSVAVRWPSVANTAAYVVELRETGSQAVERFVRSATGTEPGSLVELRVGGLRPMPGRNYMAQVRCVAACGCESAPSQPGYSVITHPGMGMGHAGMQQGAPPPMMHQGAFQQPHGTLPSLPPPQWSAGPPGPDGFAQPPMPQHQPQLPHGFAHPAPNYLGGVLPDGSPLNVPVPAAGSPPASQLVGSPTSTLAAAMQVSTVPAAAENSQTSPAFLVTNAMGTGQQEAHFQSEVPILGVAGAPLFQPPAEPPRASKSNRKEPTLLGASFKMVEACKEIAPEVTGQEECLILD